MSVAFASVMHLQLCCGTVRAYVHVCHSTFENKLMIFLMKACEYVR